MKKVLALLLALALIVALGACSSKTTEPAASTSEPSTSTETEAPAAEQSGTETAEGLVIDAALGYSEPHSMDPSICTGADQYEILFHMFEGLMKFDGSDQAITSNTAQKGFTLVCGQAESYEYDEANLTYTFHLRDGIKWRDGQDVTAQDFVYSWQRLVDPATAASNGTMLNEIVLNATEITKGEKAPSELGITAVDEKTLTVQLVNTCPYFLDLCAHYALYPLRQDAVESSSTWTEPETFVSNGAYVMTEWVHDSYIALEKNPEYYDYANLGPSKIIFHLSDNQTSNLAAYQSGDYNFVSSLPADQIESLEASGDLFVAPRLNLTYLYLNMDNIPDWRVRAAITLAIDRDNIVTNVTQDGSTPATGLIPNGVTNSSDTVWTESVGDVMFQWLQEQYPDSDLSTYGGRCELAQQLFDEAVADGWNAETSIDYQYNTSDTNRAIAEAVQADLSNVLGINTVLGNIDSAGYTDTISKGNFYMARLGYGISFNDAIGYYDLFGTNGSFEYSGWSNEEYDALYATAKSMAPGAERDAVLEQMEQLMFTDAGFSICPLYYASYTYCMDSAIQNTFYSSISSLTYFGYATK